MTLRNITIKQIEAKDYVQEIDDSLTAVVEVFHTVEALRDDKADKRFEFNATANNMHRIQKQMRAYQRSQAIRFSQDKSLSHYVFAKRKLHVKRIDKSEMCNHLKVYHLYSVKDAKDFAEIKTQILAKK